MSAFDDMSREELLRALEMFAKNWLAHDGCWFLAAEARDGMQAAIDRKPRREVAALALEGEAHLYAQLGKFDRALELYAQALPAHPNPDAIRTNIEKVRERREAARTVTPGDREAVFDRKRREHTKEVP